MADERICGPLANSLFRDRRGGRQAANQDQAACRQADAAIQKLIDLLA